MDVPAEAKAYAETDFSDVNRKFTERLLELARPGGRVAALDLGTGPGDIPLQVLRARPGWRIVAVDASRPMLRHARKVAGRARKSGALVLVLADAKRLPFAAAAFDVVFSNSLLHHITDTRALWSEIRRVARPGAAILLRDLARPADTEAAGRIVRQYAAGASALLQEEYYRSLLAAYTPNEVRAQLRRAGLGGLDVAMVSDRHLDVCGFAP